MKRTWLITCIIWILVLVIFRVEPSPLFQLLFMLVSIAWLYVTVRAIIFGFRKVRITGLKGLMPVLICVLAIPTAWLLSELGRTMYFSYKLPYFETAIKRAEGLEFAGSEDPLKLQSDSAYLVFAEKLPDGSLQLEFLTGRGFPASHSGYLYVENGQIDEASVLAQRWPRRKKIQENWYFISD